MAPLSRWWLAALALTLPACTVLSAPLSPPPVVGETAPDFTLRDPTGQQVHLSALGGEPVLINFWFTTCPPCREEMPELSRAYQQHRSQGLTVVAVNSEDEQALAVRLYAKTMSLAFPVVLDPGKKVTRRYGVTAAPTSVFVARDGRVRYLQIGAMDRAFLEQRLKDIL